MSVKTANFGVLWDFAEAVSVDVGHQWVLTAMKQHGQSLVTLLWRILGNEQDVCDAYQETFLKLAHYQAGAKPENIKAYLFRSAGNVAVSMLRRKKLHFRACQKLAQRDPQVQEGNLGDELDSMHLQEQLRLYITQLPEHLRNVTILHDLGEISYHHVGKILGISVATARVYRCRAIKLLAAWMTDRKEK